MEVDQSANGSDSVSTESAPIEYIPIEYVPNKLAADLLLYVVPVLFIIGTIGNVLTLIVMQTKEYRKTSASVVLGSLAVTDTAQLAASLLTIGFSATKELMDITAYNIASCKISYYLTSVLMYLSPALVVTMTIERLISIFAPFHAKTLCTRYRMVIAVVIVTLICAVWNLVLLVLITKRTDGYIIRCGVLEEYEALFLSFWPWVQFAVASFLPSIIIVVGNILIIRKVFMSSEAVGVQAKSQRSMSITLVLVSFCFVILTWPSCIMYTLPVFADPKPTIEVVHSVTMLLYIANSSVNFFLYCLTGSKFRRALSGVFTCRKKASRPTATNSQEAHVVTKSTNLN